MAKVSLDKKLKNISKRYETLKYLPYASSHARHIYIRFLIFHLNFFEGGIII